MKRILPITCALILTQVTSWACTVCKTQQPKLLQGITHGAGPESYWDYLIITTAVAVVVGTFTFSVRFLVKPGEASLDHVKRSILNPQSYE